MTAVDGVTVGFFNFLLYALPFRYAAYCRQYCDGLGLDVKEDGIAVCLAMLVEAAVSAPRVFYGFPVAWQTPVL